MDRRRRPILRAMGAGLVTALAGCRSPTGLDVGDRETPVTDRPTQATLEPDATYGYTHVQPSGNRVLAGGGDVRNVAPIDVQIEGTPAWLVALPAQSGSFWTVVTESGAARTVQVVDGSPSPVVEHEPLPAGSPPLIRRTGDGIGLVRPPAGSARLSHPVVTGHGVLWIDERGDLVLSREGEQQRFAVDALPDGRIVRVDADRYALLGDLTTRYRHGALGDVKEGGSLVVVDVTAGEVVTRRSVGPPSVIEGVAPIVADIDGSGDPALIVTTARSGDGARIEAFASDGRSLARGSPIGSGGWRHQLCVAPFASDGVPEIAVIRKPHVERVLEFYRRDGQTLEIEATLGGFSTHTYGSHDSDGALAADLDGDGRVELLAPRTARDQLLAVERTGGGAEVDWRLDVGGSLRTNVTGVAFPDGGVAVGAGTSTGVRVWQG